MRIRHAGQPEGQLVHMLSQPGTGEESLGAEGVDARRPVFQQPGDGEQQNEPLREGG